MATNWQVPNGLDILKVLNLQVMSDANQNVGPDVVEGQTYDPSAENRADNLVAMAVSQCRAAIQNAGGTPLSLTAGSVPPEGFRHVVNLAAYQLIISTPNLKMVIITDKGASSPFAVFYQEALQWLEKVRTGIAVTPPTDPCGADWVNPVGTQLNAIQSTATYDQNGYFNQAVAPGLFYTYTAGANDTSISAYGAIISSSNPAVFKARYSSVLLKGKPNQPVTATLIFDNPPIPGGVRYGTTTNMCDADLSTFDAPQPASFDISDLGQP